MQIKIAQRLHPFSHLPGSICLIPKSFWQVQVFPTLLRFKNLFENAEEVIIKLALQGPLLDFTVEQDLEHARVRVFGHTSQGYVRYLLFVEEHQLFLQIEKSPSMGILCQGAISMLLKERDRIALPLSHKKATFPFGQERLSLELHKAQDWELVKRRKDLREIFSIWLRLADLTPELNSSKEKQNQFFLLDKCRSVLDLGKKEEIISSFLNLFLAGFHGMLAPRLFDDDFQGLSLDEQSFSPGLSPLIILKDGASLIRSIFFQETENAVALLPQLPPEFHAGRFTAIRCLNGDEIDIEWSKKLLRRVVWRSLADRTIELKLQKPIKKLRIRYSLKERGKTISAGTSLSLKAKNTLYLDRFEK
jgi:hypothetical protein